MNLFSVNHIKQLCKELGIRPDKNIGQNFLIDERVLDDIIEAAELSKNDQVLEIGPGLGVLTKELAKWAGRVVGVEMDRSLVEYLQLETRNWKLETRDKKQETINKKQDQQDKQDKQDKQDIMKFEELGQIEIVEWDIIKWLNSGGIERYFGGIDYKVVANLPYQVTSRVLRLLLEARRKPSMMVVMAQKEVGERMCAQPGKMSVLSVACQYYTKPEIVRAVGKGSFWPVPAVESAVVKLKVRKLESFKVKKLESDRVEEKELFKIVKAGFLSRRKMLKNNLGNLYGEERVRRVLGELGLNEKIRAQELKVEEWARLARLIHSTS